MTQSYEESIMNPMAGRSLYANIGREQMHAMSIGNKDWKPTKEWYDIWFNRFDRRSPEKKKQNAIKNAAKEMALLNELKKREKPRGWWNRLSNRRYTGNRDQYLENQVRSHFAQHAAGKSYTRRKTRRAPKKHRSRRSTR